MTRNLQHSDSFDSFDSFDSPRLSRSTRAAYAFAIYSTRGDCLDFGSIVARSERDALAKIKSRHADSIPPRAQIIIHLDSEG